MSRRQLHYVILLNRRQLHYVILLCRLETVHFPHILVQLSLIFFVRSKKLIFGAWGNEEGRNSRSKEGHLDTRRLVD